MQFTGWLKDKGSEWRPVCHGDSWDACWRLLIRIRAQADACEKLVNQGKHPEQRRKPR